jgi:Fe-S-cluster-containing dehydrogenase component
MKVAQHGPWLIGEDKWEYLFVPAVTELCTLCSKRVKSGKLPTCVQHCQAAVITYGPLEELAKRMVGKTKHVLFSR